MNPERAQLIAGRMRMALADIGHDPGAVVVTPDGIIGIRSKGIPTRDIWRAGVLADGQTVCFECWHAWSDVRRHAGGPVPTPNCTARRPLTDDCGQAEGGE